jgi:hypothetical protein
MNIEGTLGGHQDDSGSRVNDLWYGVDFLMKAVAV